MGMSRVPEESGSWKEMVKERGMGGWVFKWKFTEAMWGQEIGACWGHGPYLSSLPLHLLNFKE